MARRTFAYAALLVVLPYHQPAIAAVRAGQATAVIREGIRSSDARALPKVQREARTVRTIVRPCNVAQPHILCTIVLTEIH